MEVSIRVATPNDIDAIFRVRTSVRENALTIEGLAELGITPASVTEMLSMVPCSWVAVAGEVVVGFSMVDLEDACLFAAFVSPDYEGRGIGKALVAAAEAALFERHSKIWLETSKTSRAAEFYHRSGWSEVENIGEDDVKFEKVR